MPAHRTRTDIQALIAKVDNAIVEWQASTDFRKHPLGIENSGTNLEWLVYRMFMERPDVLSRLRDGEFQTVCEAAREAGVLKDVPSPLDDPQRLARAILKRKGADGAKKFLEAVQSILSTA